MIDTGELLFSVGGTSVSRTDSEPDDEEADPDFPLRSGPRYLAGFVVFVVVNVVVYFTTGEIGPALAIAFVLWLVAVLIARFVER